MSTIPPGGWGSSQMRQFVNAHAAYSSGGITFYGTSSTSAVPINLSALPEETKWGELRGWRAWEVAETPDGLRLRSVATRTIWFSGTMASEEGERNSGDVKNSACCGYYSFRNKGALFDQMLNEKVYGEVLMWGDVVEHERGYRAECVKIVSLYAGRGLAHGAINDLRKFYLEGI